MTARAAYVFWMLFFLLTMPADAADRCGAAADGYSGGTGAMYDCAGLPHTGSDVGWLVIGGLVLLMVGLVLRDRARRV